MVVAVAWLWLWMADAATRTPALDDDFRAGKRQACRFWFATEFAQLTAAVGNTAAAKGDHVTLLNVPGEGVRVQVGQKVDVTIKSPTFAQALWEVYLGPKPLDEGLKKGLVAIPTP